MEMNNEEKQESVWSKAIPFKEQVAIFKRLMGFVKHFKFEMTIALIGAFLVSIINILLPRGLQYFLDNFLLKQSATVQIILFAGLLYAIGSILKAVIQFTYQYFFALGSEKTLESIRRALYRKLHKLGMRYFDQTPAGSIVSRVTNDTMTLSDFLGVLCQVVIGVFSLVTAFIAMYVTNKFAALIVLLFLPILGVIFWIYTQKSSRLYRAFRERLSRINTNLNESIEGVSLIQQFKQEKRMTNHFENENGTLMRTRFNLIRVNSLLLSPMTSLLYSLALALVLMYFGFPLQKTFVPAGIVYAFSQYVQQFFNPISTMMDRMTSFQDGIVAGKRIFRIMDEKEYDSITVEKVIDAFFVNTKESYKDEDGKLKIKEQVIGYYTDATFAEQIGINYQPDFFAVTSIKGKSRHGDLKHFCGEEIVIKKPYVMVNEENQKILQLIDLIIQLEDCKYCTEDNWVQRILEYMKQEGISFSDMNRYIFCYPSYHQRSFLNNKIKREERLRRKYIMPGTKWSTFHKV